MNSLCKTKGKTRTTSLLVEIVRDFIVYLKKERNFSRWTLKSYKAALSFFLDWAKENNIYEVQTITRETLENYRRYLTEYQKSTGECLQTTTINLRLHKLRCFFMWLTKRCIILYNPALSLRLVKEARKLPRHILSPKEIRQILGSINTKSAIGTRNRAIIELLYSTGIRKRELMELTPDSFDFEQRILFIRRGKNQRDRLVPVGYRAIRWVRKYLFEVRPLWQNRFSHGRLFLDQKGFAISGPNLGNVARNHIRSIGKSGSCHLFRHSMATHMLENGADLRYVQGILGHETIETTKVYTHVSIAKLKEIHAATLADIRTGKIPDTVSKKTKPRRQGKSAKAEKKMPAVQGDLSFLVGKYKEELGVLNYSPFTIRKKHYVLKGFLAWSKEKKVYFVKDVSRKTIESYIHDDYDKRPHLSASSRVSVFESLKGFFAWLYEKNHVLVNPAGHLENPKRPKSLPRYILTPEEVKKIFKAPDLTAPVGFRDRAILELLYSTGLRRKELCSLFLEDINFETKTVFIREGKGRKDRYVPAGSSALRWILKYIQLIRPIFLRGKESPYLFVSLNAGKLNETYLGIQISGYVKKANINKKGGCLLFRHSMATTMLENGADIRFIQQMLGHTELSTTQLYTHVSLGKLKEVHARTHPAERGI